MPLNIPYLDFTWVLKLLLHTSAIAAMLCRVVTETTPTSNELSVVTAHSQQLPLQIEKRASLSEMEALHGWKTVF